MEASDTDESKPTTVAEEPVPEKSKRSRKTRSRAQIAAFEKARARRKAICDEKRKAKVVEEHKAYVESLEKRAASKKKKKKPVVVSSSSESSESESSESEPEPEPPRRRSKARRARRRRSPSPVSESSDDEPAPPPVEHDMTTGFVVV